MEMSALSAPCVVERAIAPVYFINGILQIDHIGGGNLLFTFYRDQASLDGSRALEREVEFKVIAHCGIIPACAKMALLAAAKAAVNFIDAPSISL